jgi:hypothetical protein
LSGNGQRFGRYHVWIWQDFNSLRVVIATYLFPDAYVMRAIYGQVGVVLVVSIKPAGIHGNYYTKDGDSNQPESATSHNPIGRLLT